MFKPVHLVVVTFVLLTVTACTKKSDALPAMQSVVTFSVRFDSGPNSWSRSYTEAECSAPSIQDFGGQNTFFYFKATPALGEECWVEVFGIDRSEVLPGTIGTYNGDGLFATKMSFRPRGATCHIPAVAYTNRHGNPYTFTISSYDAKTRRASGNFDLDLGGQADPSLCPQQGGGRVQVQGTFRDVVLPY